MADPKRCTDHRFFIDPAIYHREILLSCLNLMNERLERNICRIDDHVLLSNVEDLPARRVTYIGDAVGYTCCFWANHLMMTPGCGPDVEEVWKAIDKFFTIHLLFWIEVLSLRGDLDVGVHALNDVQKWYTMVGCA